MKVPASHIRHIKNKKLFNKGRAYLEARGEVLRHSARRRKPLSALDQEK